MPDDANAWLLVLTKCIVCLKEHEAVFFKGQNLIFNVVAVII